MTITDYQLSAYLDAALTPDEAAMVIKAIHGKPALRARLSALKAADALAARHFSGIDDRPLPEGVKVMLGITDDDRTGGPEPGKSDGVLPFGRRRPRQGIPGLLTGIAASVALLLGFGGGWLATDHGMRLQTAYILNHSIGLVGTGHPLHAALESTRSGETRILGGVEGERMTPMLSFASINGLPCRDVALESQDGGQRTLFCKSDERGWRMVASAAISGHGGGDFRLAASDAPEIIERLIDEMIKGSPFRESEESRAIDEGWPIDGERGN